MLDIRRIRSEFDTVKSGLERRGEDPAKLDEIRSLDERHREIAAERDDLRHRVKQVSNEVGALLRDGKAEEARVLQDESRAMGSREEELAGEADRISADIRNRLLHLPNLPSDKCPDGLTEDENVVLRTEGFDPAAYAPHQRVPHWDIGSELLILDVERAVKMSGSMFVMYRGLGAALVRALCQLAIDRNADTFEEVRPPTMVSTETMVGTGHLPKFEEDAYHLERDDLWAIPTAEVPLTSLARDEILAEQDLPLRLMAHTACFRREAGSAGRDTRGLLRVHEFDKVELLAYATADQAEAVHADILGRAEALLVELGLAYRVVDLCAGDLGNSSARTFDLEVYAPGVDRWLEVSSVSWFSDYQARRANIRYRPKGAKGTEVVHTLNGSGLAVPRVWAALVETHRQADGTVELPGAIRPYMRGASHIPLPS